MKESEPISHKNPQFKPDYPLDDVCFILDYFGCNKFTDEMTSIFGHCPGSLPDFFKVSVLQ